MLLFLSFNTPPQIYIHLEIYVWIIIFLLFLDLNYYYQII